MTEIYKKYRGLWVAMTKDRQVVASGEDGKKVFEEARAKGVEVPLLYHVPKSQDFYIGGAYL
ncbi:hypothetical protein A3B21_00025 [Candidatus Uhrbacteria bacterium RIFCSPLOWO2_01_FULL_47_24]|uniref:DUF5678 domain-containing protein n=1 Tax=Candidatus Uhrbacteria bacterium RIFCSPLOWO2_01_FULL_47_24 TaxID=1802401 RepID=A0A1F7UU20_9BACT|nr:MAG: hypothetical protein A3D58_03080 [Candidatus Uhrbacteria bacterium RIFCSPHIGHO2_02_FULL_46_47]OGL81749.1 MAG: hypothetical protein A3B21_00025 [Candidatus Uhrbacteria bacterium RIFCSPLOWO2_01_FULL_47_24]OGL85382.1 MAG: hypothetical protein A3J03_04855 [Candidatus Uhrbacteria bacterium RIFCSPLOWO2_02_FULL_46_25]OGL91834.1 MAG: hypothetical protein A3H11_02785 [Candidatus Uhrbacteria bacterium RIFCSPLOWO2_12_FULL_47_10]